MYTKSTSRNLSAECFLDRDAREAYAEATENIGRCTDSLDDRIAFIIECSACSAVHSLVSFESPKEVEENLRKYQLENAELIERCSFARAKLRHERDVFVALEWSNVQRARKRAIDEDTGVSSPASVGVYREGDDTCGRIAHVLPRPHAQPRPIRFLAPGHYCAFSFSEQRVRQSIMLQKPS